MQVTPQQLADLVTAQRETERLLDELARMGFRSKSLDHYRFEDKPGCGCWISIDRARGWVRLQRSWTPGLIAHELGHGFHECLRTDYGLVDAYGEDYAEAIRWFVEERLGWHAWRQDFSARCKRDDRILLMCRWAWVDFRHTLRDRRFYPT